MRTDATLEQYRDLLRQDPYAFTERAFAELNPQTRFLRNGHIEVLVAKLEDVRRGRIRRLIINVPPRSLKSHCASVAFPAWLLGHDSTVQILAVSYGQDLADKLARECRALISSPFFKALFRTRLSPNKQAVGEFETTAKGYRLSTSVGGVLTGRGADYIIIDDPMKPEEALSEARRQAVNNWYDNTLYSRLNNKASGAIILIMQRLHEYDLVGHVLGQEPWEVVSFAAIAEHDEAYLIANRYGSRRVQRKAGEALHPDHEPLETLDRIRRTIGEYNFAAQYQQTPTPPAGLMIKEKWFQRYDPHELPSSFDEVVQSWDTANKATELSDYSVCTTWGVKDNRYYLLNVFRRKIEYPELKRMVRELARLHRATVVLIEDKASGTQLIQELTVEGLHAITRYEPTGDKLMRLYAQTATIENGFVYLPKDAPWLAEYLHELTTFPNARHDDQADATAQALCWLKMRPPEPGIIGYYRMVVERMKGESERMVRVTAPPGISHVSLQCGRQVCIGSDRTVELSEKDAAPLIRAGWAKIA